MQGIVYVFIEKNVNHVLFQSCAAHVNAASVRWNWCVTGSQCWARNLQAKPSTWWWLCARHHAWIWHSTFLERISLVASPIRLQLPTLIWILRWKYILFFVFFKQAKKNIVLKFRSSNVSIKIGLCIGVAGILFSMLVSACCFFYKTYKVNWNLDRCATWFFIRLLMCGSQPRSERAIPAPPVNLIELWKEKEVISGQVKFWRAAPVLHFYVITVFTCITRIVLL